jgi:uncharacterized protein
MLAVLVVTLCAFVVCLVYGWLEAGWLKRRVLDVSITGLPTVLEGLRIGHLSDFHLGAPLSRGNRASRKAVAWIADRQPDLVCITGDLVSHPRGERVLRLLLGHLDDPIVVLGNHDIADTRDPFSRATELRGLERTRLLTDQVAIIDVRGHPVSVVGVDPESYRLKRTRPHELAGSAGPRVLLCHFPGIVHRVPGASFDLILAGHLHAGQICLPIPGSRVMLAHPRSEFVSGIYETEAGTMHVSPGTGTSFVPFRFFARPEVTELVLRRRD